MIRLDNVQDIRDGRAVIDIPKLSIPSGEAVAFIGPAQSGVDELYEVFIGRSGLSSGSLTLGDLDPRVNRDLFSHKVGVMFESDGLYETRTVRANLVFAARLYGLPKDRVAEVLNELGLRDQGGIRVDRLSAALRRRVAFGRVLLHQPEYLILNKPFARCNQESITWLQRLIREQAETGVSVVIFDRERAWLESLCDVIHVLEAGRIVESSSLEERQEAQLPFKIPVKGEGSVSLIHPAELMYANADEGKAHLHLLDGRILRSQFTLSELEQRLQLRGFFRAHRGYLVNLQHVSEVIPFTRDSYSLRLSDPEGSLVPLSKTAASDLRELLGF